MGAEQKSVYYSISGISNRRNEPLIGRGASGWSIISKRSTNIFLTNEHDEERTLTLGVKVRKEAHSKADNATSGFLTPTLFDSELHHAQWLLTNEEAILRHLSQKGNQFVPHLIGGTKKYFDMTYIDGVVPENEQLPSDLSLNTRLFITHKAFDAVRQIFMDGVTCIDYAPRNLIAQVNEDGIPYKVIVLDFGHGLLIDNKNKTVSTTKRLIHSQKDIPPEFERGEFKSIQAEPLTVWAFSHVMEDILPRNKEIDEFILTMKDSSPGKRPTFDQINRFIISLGSSNPIEPVLSREKIVQRKLLMNAYRDEIVIPEKSIQQVARALQANF